MSMVIKNSKPYPSAQHSSRVLADTQEPSLLVNAAFVVLVIGMAAILATAIAASI